MKRAELTAIIQKCEYRFNRGTSSEWKHSDYDDLRREIRRATKVVISTNTLKRIFGKIEVEEDYFPQRATIEALRVYSGATFPFAMDIPFAEEKKPADPLVVSKLGVVPQKLKSRWWGVGVFLALITIFSVAYFCPSSDEIKAEIMVSAVEGELPVTVFFDLELPVTEDSIFIDFGDKSPRKYIVASQKVAHNYLFPDVFRVKLYVGKRAIATTDVTVRSNKWVALGYHWQRDLPNRYYVLPISRNPTDSLFHIPNAQMYKLGLDTTTTFFTRVSNYTDIDATADSFVFETVFKNMRRGSALYCNSTQFQITGEEGMIRFRFVNSGCSYRVLNRLAEKAFDGSKMNLSEFVIATDEWNNVRLINQDKHVTLFVNNKKIFEDHYETSLGKLKGLFIEFEGNGYLKDCKLQSSEGKPYFQF